MERNFEFNACDPLIHPADLALDRLQTRKCDPDGVIRFNADRQLDPAALRRNVNDINFPAMLAGAPEIDIRL